MTFALESFVLLAEQLASPRGFAARRENHRLHMIGDTSSLWVVSASPMSSNLRAWPLNRLIAAVFFAAPLRYPTARHPAGALQRR